MKFILKVLNGHKANKTIYTLGQPRSCVLHSAGDGASPLSYWVFRGLGNALPWSSCPGSGPTSHHQRSLLHHTYGHTTPNRLELRTQTRSMSCPNIPTRLDFVSYFKGLFDLQDSKNTEIRKSQDCNACPLQSYMISYVSKFVWFHQRILSKSFELMLDLLLKLVQRVFGICPRGNNKMIY